MDCPTLPAVLNLLHGEKANRVPVAHHSKSRCDAVSQEIKIIVVPTHALDKSASLGCYPDKEAIFFRLVGTIVVLGNLDDLHTMRFRPFGFEHSNVCISLRMDSLSDVFIKHNMVDIPAVHHLPDYLGAILKAKVDLEAGPIIGYITVGYVVSAVECYLV